MADTSGAALAALLMAQQRNNQPKYDPADRSRRIAERLMLQSSNQDQPVYSVGEGVARALQGTAAGVFASLADQRALEKQQKSLAWMTDIYNAPDAATRNQIMSKVPEGVDPDMISPVIVSALSQKLANEQAMSQGAQTYNSMPKLGGDAGTATGGAAAGPAVGGTPGNLASYEGGNNPKAINPQSGAGGLYQFMPGTWQDVRASNPDLNLPANVTDATAEQQTAAEQRFRAGNAAALTSMGFQPTPANLYIAHRAGVEGAKNILSASEDAPMSTIVPGSWIAQNPDMRTTVGAFRKMAENRFPQVEPSGGANAYVPLPDIGTPTAAPKVIQAGVLPPPGAPPTSAAPAPMTPPAMPPQAAGPQMAPPSPMAQMATPPQGAPAPQGPPPVVPGQQSLPPPPPPVPVGGPPTSTDLPETSPQAAALAKQSQEMYRNARTPEAQQQAIALMQEAQKADAQWKSERAKIIDQRTQEAAKIKDQRAFEQAADERKRYEENINKGLNTEQAQNATFSDRMIEAQKTLNQLEEQGTHGYQRFLDSTVFGVGIPGSVKPYVGQTPEFERFQNAKMNWINALLRNEAGARLTPEQQKQMDEQYFPQPGNSAEVIADKRKNRILATEGMTRAAGPNYSPNPRILGGEAPPGAADLKKKYGLE